jgi:hypothetical protein
VGSSHEALIETDLLKGHKLMGKLWAVFLILFGLTLLGWIGYNLFVEMQPEARGKNPIIPTILGIGALALGISKLMKAK